MSENPLGIDGFFTHGIRTIANLVDINYTLSLSVQKRNESLHFFKIQRMVSSLLLIVITVP